MSQEPNKPRPCPFCGFAPAGPLALVEGKVWTVNCRGQLSHDAHSMSWVSAEDAVRIWNRRPGEFEADDGRDFR
jgi:hypothetical protein